MSHVTLEELRAPVARHIDALNAHMESRLVTPNAMMTAVIRSYLEGRGKQLRPILVFLAAGMVGEPNEATMLAAEAVELLHNASLIHDDVVDRSDTRHGRPTINAVWDNHIAVLVGDFFVSKALEAATATADLRIIGRLAALGQLLSVGEMDQICNARSRHTSEDDYYLVVSRKTASLFEACVEMGAYSVGADDSHPLFGPLKQFANLLGICFQIRDDIFDYQASPLPGKPTGNDLLEGKVTLPLIHALASNHPQAADMRALMTERGDSLSPAEVERLTAFAREAGGIDYAVERMHALRSQAAALVDAPRLLALFDYIIARAV